MIAHTMTVFDIKPALDGKGNEIKFKPDVTGGLISCVLGHCSQLLTRHCCLPPMCSDNLYRFRVGFYRVRRRRLSLFIILSSQNNCLKMFQSNGNDLRAYLQRKTKISNEFDPHTSRRTYALVASSYPKPRSSRHAGIGSIVISR